MARLEFTELDFYNPNDLVVPLTFSSLDFRDLSSRKGAFSKTITLPASKRNDAFFGYNFDVTSEGRYNHSVRLPIIIEEIDFLGTMQLKSVNFRGNTTISYSVSVFGDLGDWVNLIGEGSIRDLKHHGSHVFNAATVEASWTNNGVTGEFVYPVISYGGLMQDKNATDPVFPSEMRPAFFVLPLLRQIFKEVGYTLIDNGVVNIPHFRDLILPFTTTNFELQDIPYEVTAEHNTHVAFFFDRLSGVNDTYYSDPLLFETETLDEQDLFSLASSLYTVPGNDTYTMNIEGTFQAGAGPANANEEVMWTEIVVYDQDGGVVAASNTNTSVGSLTIEDSFNLSINLDNVALTEGDVLEIKLNTVVKGIGNGLRNSAVNFVNHTLQIKPNNLILEAEQDILHKEFIQDVKKIDLLRDIMRMGNFRLLTDVGAKTVELIIEENFFQTTPEDWTGKQDESQSAAIEFISNMGAKEYVWGYNNDSDDVTIKEAEEQYDRKWGEKKIELESEHRKGSQTIHSSIFSVTMDGIALRNPIKMPVLRKDLSTLDFDAGFKNRILVYKGLTNGSWNFNNTPKTSYPYCLFSESGFSLRFDDKADVGTSTATTFIGLANRFYSGAIERQNNAKLYTGWFYLTDRDISTLNFRTPKIINGIQYYLNTVIDYQVGANKPTKVELISR